MPSHNIVGCEAIADHRQRLVAFSHAHGSIVELPRRGGRRFRTLLTITAGAAALIGAAILLARL